MNISQYRIPGAPQDMYYIADFITESEEEAILNKIPAHRWTTLAHRRLQAVPTQLTSKNTLLASSLPEWLVKPTVQRIESCGIFKGSPHGVNHCLINEYLPGQGIMPHEDGAAYHPVVATVSLGGTIVLDVALKADCSTDSSSATDNAPCSFRPTQSHENTPYEGPWRIVQEPRSLLVTMGVAYTDALHGIAEVEEDMELRASTIANWHLLADKGKLEAAGGRSTRSERISLTFRDVKRVSSVGNHLLGRARS